MWLFILVSLIKGSPRQGSTSFSGKNPLHVNPWGILHSEGKREILSSTSECTISYLMVETFTLQYVSKTISLFVCLFTWEYFAHIKNHIAAKSLSMSATYRLWAGMIFIVQHLLCHRASVFAVSCKRLAQYIVASYKKQGYLGSIRTNHPLPLLWN